MANITTTINNMAKSRIMPDVPEKSAKAPMVDPTKLQIENVVDRLAQPWKYGRSRQEHCKQCDVTKEQYEAIKTVYFQVVATKLVEAQAVEK